MWLGKERKSQVLKDLDNIYQMLCADDISGSFRSNYILKQLDDLHWLIDPKGKGRKRYERRKSKLQNLI